MMETLNEALEKDGHDADISLSHIGTETRVLLTLRNETPKPHVNGLAQPKKTIEERTDFTRNYVLSALQKKGEMNINLEVRTAIR